MQIKTQQLGIYLLIVSVILLVMQTAQQVYAHPGRTAADNCHYCRTNCSKWGVSYGVRHCHQNVRIPQSSEPTWSHKNDTIKVWNDYKTSESAVAFDPVAEPIVKSGFAVGSKSIAESKPITILKPVARHIPEDITSTQDSGFKTVNTKGADQKKEINILLETLQILLKLKFFGDLIPV